MGEAVRDGGRGYWELHTFCLILLGTYNYLESKLYLKKKKLREGLLQIRRN